METYYWNDLYNGWGWFLWLGMIFLIFSSFGNWGYTYKAHRLYRSQFAKDATDFLNERYAKGEINREEFYQLQIEIRNSRSNSDRDDGSRSSKILQPQT